MILIVKFKNLSSSINIDSYISEVIINTGEEYLEDETLEKINSDLEIYLMISLYIQPILMGLSIFFSIILGGIVAIILLILGKRKAYIPFVPFISLGTLLSVFFGCQALNWYIGLF